MGACTPNDYECNGAALLQCTSGGTSLEFVQTCATAALCNAGAGQCDTPACAPNDHDCSGTSLLVCNSDRDDFVEQQTCVTAALCDADGGTCQPPACAQNEYQCNGNVLRVCNSGRTGFQTVQSCGASQLCTTSPPECQDLMTVLEDFDGFLIELPCGDQPNTDDCALGGYRINGGSLNACMSNQMDAQTRFTVGGTAGAVYNATLHLYGIVEPKVYGSGVTREAAGASNRTEGGTPTPWATAPGGHVPVVSNYMTYEIRVSDESDQEVGVYYVNSDSGEGHWTFAINFQKTIQVIGGGEILIRVNDNNCRIIKNCGENGGAPCAGKARTINVSAADPQPTNLSQPNLGFGDAGHSGQWLLIDVVNVAPE